METFRFQDTQNARITKVRSTYIDLLQLYVTKLKVRTIVVQGIQVNNDQTC